MAIKPFISIHSDNEILNRMQDNLRSTLIDIVREILNIQEKVKKIEEKLENNNG